MAANTPVYAQTLTYNTQRNRSSSIWKGTRILDVIEGSVDGVHIFDDFDLNPDTTSSAGGVVLGSFGRWAFYVYTGATFSTPTGGAQGGVIALASDGDNEGAALHSTAGAVQLASGGNPVWFETRVAFSTVANTKNDCFVGLVEGFAPAAAKPITATDDTLADQNLIGFHRIGGDGDQIDFVYKADGQTVQYAITDMVSSSNSVAGALAADTYIKLGFYFNPDAIATERIKVYINGLASTTFITGTQMDAATFPDDVYLSPALAMFNQTGSTPGSFYCDWIRCLSEFR